MARTAQTLTDRIREMAEETIAGRGLFLVEVSVRGARGSQVVDVYVDSEETVGVDDLAQVSRELGFLLDTEDVIESKYNLNVSTPGLDRPLSDIRQFPKHADREVVVRYEEDGEERFAVGVIEGVEGAEVVIDLDEDEHEGGGRLRLPFDRIEEARIRLPW